MNLLIAFLAFVVGASIGSFLGVVIDRLPRGQSIIVGRSFCESCKKKLSERDMFPVISYVLLAGRCRFCHKKIPIRLFLVEVTVGLAFVLFFLLFSSGFLTLISYLYISMVFCLFTVIFFTDIDFGIIPDQVVMALLIAILGNIFLFNSTLFVNHLISGIVSCFIFLAIYLATRGRGMGFGDVKLAGILGLFLGFPNIVVGLYLAFLTGAAVSIILIICGIKKLKGDTIPFGPFLVLSSFLAYFIGPQMIAAAMTFLH